MHDNIGGHSNFNNSVLNFNFAEFSLNLYERFRGTYIDLDKCVLEWNHDDMAQVGGSSVLTVKVGVVVLIHELITVNS